MNFDLDVDSEMPPQAPEVERSGILVVDVTGQFGDAAGSMFFSFFS